MTRGRTEQVMVVRPDRGRAPDRVIVEEPMEIRLDDALVTTTMRTPGHDFELAAGFLYGEGLLAGAPVRQVRYCATGSAVETEFNIVSVETGGLAPPPVARLVTTTSSCGLCGSTSIEELTTRLPRLDAPAPIEPTVLAALAERVRAQQELFDTTGSVHAAAVFDPATGEISLVREDIGRHNAVDKVVGRMLLDGRLPATGLGLFVSGRASFEMVQKAWAAGFGLVAAVSGPSSLAIEAARAGNLALVGFLRGEAMNVYSPVDGPPGTTVTTAL